MTLCRTMRQVKTKYRLLWIAITILFATIIWGIVHFMPNEGWVFWASVIGIVLLAVAYLCLIVVLIALYAVDAYQDEIKFGFSKLEHAMIEACNDYYKTMCSKFYASLERLFK